MLAAVASTVGWYFLLRRGHGNASRVFALSVYSFSLVFLFSMSGVYHLLTPGTVAKDVLQRLDYAGIWVLIAGTFTPIHTILFRGAWRWAILALVWTAAITGLVLQVIFFHSFPEWLGLTFFLGLGWVGALTGIKFHHLFQHKTVKYLLAGGLFYSIGAIIDFLKGPVLILGVIGAHEIFHIFVILGALSHWVFVWRWAGHPVYSSITFNVQIFGDNKFIARAKGESVCVESDNLKDLKTKIRAAVESKYYPRPIPTIHLKYFHEEHI